MFTPLVQIHPISNFNPHYFSSHNPLIFFTYQLPQNPKTLNYTLSSLNYKRKTPFQTLIKCSQNSDSNSPNWERLIPKDLISAEKILRSIAGATSSPICQFISSPTTFLHSVDSRIKLAWLLVLVMLPARSHIYMRFGLIGFLALLSVWIQPRQVWVDQLGRVTLLSGILFLMLGLGADSAPMVVQSRTPPPSMMGLPSIPPSFDGYSYLLFKVGPLQLTRKGLSVASTSACLTFTIFQSASLCLTTTTPEQLAFALQWFIKPLAYVGVPVAEVILTLLLSLRFINLVFDEVRIVALGIVSRRINWQQLATMETVEVFFTYMRRIFKNIFNHAEQITQAMTVRGFNGDSSSHNIYFSSASSAPMANIVSVMTLLGLIGAAALSEYVLV
ncbi:protein ABCI12, chloroplastic-like [Rutidosis leptorrhynchoides]|uniref:protein ABCI12, chloroplastic-like n=1 Tax=Rutidosis leptorrhynchoides TaxID=125765 RepID=UPI003A9A2B81